MEDTNKIGKDVAEAEFARFIDEMDLNIDTKSMDAEDLTGFNKQKDLLLRELTRGNLVVNESGEFEYTPHRKGSKFEGTITFYERSGSSLMATDGKKKNQEAHKLYAMMAEMTKTHPSTFSKLVGTDIKVCEAIFSLLMD